MDKIVLGLFILGALICNSWLFYFFIKQFKKIYLPDVDMHIFKIVFFAWATIQSFMFDTIIIKWVFFDGKSLFILFLDLIFVIIFGYLFSKAIWMSTVPRVKYLKINKIILLILFYLYSFGMIKISYF